LGRFDMAHKLTGIEAGRGIAALLVLGVHTRDHLYKGFGRFPLGDLFVFGHAGVDFFFVLSGFIIFYVHAGDIGQPRQLMHYLRRRFTRIYPFYWVISLLALAAAAVSAHQEFPSAENVIASALLLPLSEVVVVPVAWTLQHEIIFYAMFSVTIVNRKIGIALLGLWLGLIISRLYVPYMDIGPVSNAFNFHFFFGMATAWLLQRRTIPAPLIVLLLGTSMFFLVGGTEDLGLVQGTSLITHFGYSAGSAIAILGLVEVERQKAIHVPRVMIELGGASYAIYLTHLLGIGAVWQIMLVTRLSDFLPLWAAFILLFAGGALIGWIISRTVERPVIAIARHLTGPKTTPLSVATLASKSLWSGPPK
jgi:exopolysaccharide production protein ExoZ